MEFNIASTLILYTDGLSEAVSKGHMLGVKGVENFVRIMAAQGSTAQSIESALSNTADLTVTDDVTVVVVKRMA